ncbi:hypothetical protein [Nocardia sp. NPDC060259]|uniref:hypothetical protein n=1 Tax=Nocardia sp. NPDC060259 TaxID=3347088 RepID=UPI00365F6845
MHDQEGGKAFAGGGVHGQGDRDEGGPVEFGVGGFDEICEGVVGFGGDAGGDAVELSGG